MKQSFPSCNIFILLLLLAVTSCNPQKKIQRRGGYLLVKNSVKTDNSSIPSEEIEGFVQQKATSGRLSLFKPGVWIYETTSKGKQTHLKTKIREKYGTPLVILDTNLAIRTEQNICIYLHNKGFFHPKISHNFRFKGSSVTALYKIIAGEPNIIGKINYEIPDPQLSSYFNADTSNSLLHEDMIFDTYLLDDERDRITQHLRNQGYYSFSKSNITYLADTATQGTKTTLTLRILRHEFPLTDSSHAKSNQVFPRFFIRNIYIMPDLDQSLIQSGNYDTLVYNYHPFLKDSTHQIFYFIHSKKNRLKPIAVANSINLRTGQAYNQEVITQTYKKLIGLPIVRSANIRLSLADDKLTSGSELNWLDCSVKLTRNPVNLLSLGTEGTNSSGSLGLGFNALYQNRNIFKGAETFRFKINTGAELQANVPQTDGENKLWIFNAIETGVEAGIDFPRLLLPNSLFRNTRLKQSRTSFVAGFGFESRPAYSRNISTFSGSYQWSVNQNLKHIFTPIELNFVRIVKDSAFQAYLSGLTDPQFIGQYNDHLLTMIRYSLVYSNQMQKGENVFFVRYNAETSGNVFQFLDHLSSGNSSSEGYYKRFGIRYAQYFRTDLDFRKFWNFRASRALAFRVMIGAGVPYGNSDAIPFEKSFWLGGANDMRGWRLRSLGPGSYTNDSVRYDRTGDLLFYSSIEYRFPVYSFVKAAFFSDAGNIWLREKNLDFPEGNFQLKSMGNQLAIDCGTGLRFDFSFFVFRLDWAFRLKNPEYVHQWFQPEDFRLKKAVWNFGIGYPF